MRGSRCRCVCERGALVSGHQRHRRARARAITQDFRNYADASKIVGGEAMLQIVRKHYRGMRANQTVAYVKRMEERSEEHTSELQSRI